MTLTEPATVWTDTDRRMMARALELAAKGVGQVSPGPLVGCVIVSPAGEIVGEGHYIFEAIKHAETIALRAAAPLAGTLMDLQTVTLTAVSSEEDR